MWEFCFVLVLLCVFLQPVLIIIAGEPILTRYCSWYRVFLYFIAIMCIVVTFPVSMITCTLAILFRNWIIRRG